MFEELQVKQQLLALDQLYAQMRSFRSHYLGDGSAETAYDQARETLEASLAGEWEIVLVANGPSRHGLVPVAEAPARWPQDQQSQEERRC